MHLAFVLSFYVDNQKVLSDENLKKILLSPDMENSVHETRKK